MSRPKTPKPEATASRRCNGIVSVAHSQHTVAIIVAICTQYRAMHGQETQSRVRSIFTRHPELCFPQVSFNFILDTCSSPGLSYLLLCLFTHSPT